MIQSIGLPMLKYITIIVLSTLLACTKLDLESIESDCMKHKIKDFRRARATCDAGASIEKYSFQDQIVYTFFRGNCGADFVSEVFNLDCQLIGGLGGISGNKIVNGEDFSNAILLDKIWSN